MSKLLNASPIAADVRRGLDLILQEIRADHGTERRILREHLAANLVRVARYSIVAGWDFSVCMREIMDAALEIDAKIPMAFVVRPYVRQLLDEAIEDQMQRVYLPQLEVMTRAATTVLMRPGCTEHQALAAVKQAARDSSPTVPPGFVGWAMNRALFRRRLRHNAEVSGGDE